MKTRWTDIGTRNQLNFFKRPNSRDYNLRIAETAFRNWRSQRKVPGLRRSTSLKQLWSDAKDVTPFARVTPNGLHALPPRFPKLARGVAGLTRFAGSFRKPIRLSNKSLLNIGYGVRRKGVGAYGGLGAFAGLGRGWRKLLKQRGR